MHYREFIHINRPLEYYSNLVYLTARIDEKCSNKRFKTYFEDSIFGRFIHENDIDCMVEYQDIAQMVRLKMYITKEQLTAIELLDIVGTDTDYQYEYFHNNFSK